MAKRRVATLPDGQGRFTVVFDDGTTLTVDAAGQIVAQDDTPNPLRAAAFRSGQAEDEEAAKGLAREASAESARRFDLELIERRNAARQQYEASMMNARTNQEQAEATREYQRAQTQLAKERLAFDERNSNADRGLRLLETRANLTGPDKVFEAYDYDRGAGAMQDTPVFLHALRNGSTLAGFTGQGGRPAPVTLDSMAAKLSPGYGATQEARTMENALATIDDISAAGAHKLRAGALEQLRPDEFKAFQSGQGKGGYSTANFLDAYRRSRVNQGFSAGAA